ncbi:hypothetical protein ACFUGD_19545 [Streptomyces sp. NPDC057217]|uniref:hypothetical protein n=1 Tax=Streptomyces sp. NPDC057217 TaxID=3346054 RepID=UPI00363FE4C7
MSNPSDDRSDLTAIEHALTGDDPVLAARMDTLDQQFSEETAPHPATPRHDVTDAWRPLSCWAP